MIIMDKRRARLRDELAAAFETHPLEDGMDHPAERIMERALQSEETRHVLEELRRCALDATRPDFAAAVLRCLGGCAQAGIPAWRTALVRDALAMDEIEIRDATVQAAEWWGGQAMRSVLGAHVEPVPWLRAYIQDVVEDLRTGHVPGWGNHARQ